MDNNRIDGHAFPSSSQLQNNNNSPRGRSKWVDAPRRSKRHQDIDTNTSIPLSNLHRRQSRDNNAESGNEGVSQEREQEISLPDLGSDFVHVRGDRHGLHWDYRYLLQMVDVELSWIIALVALLLCVVYLSSRADFVPSFQIQEPYNLGTSNLNETLGILLHPQDHAYRRPKQLIQYWNITSEYRTPDGVLKKVYLVNGQFPGPLIECRTGDRLSIHVTNQLRGPEEKISIHWHGLNMRSANSMDGASGFTQCSIPSGGSFVYDFEIDSDSVGTFWYHAHSDVQRGDGMYGGLVVHDVKGMSRDVARYKYEKEVLLLIGDWYHRSASEVLNWYMSVQGSKNEPVPDSLLINGVGKFACAKSVPARPVQCWERWKDTTPGLFDESLRGIPTRLRVVNVGSLAGFTLGVSSGSLTPLTVDGGHPIMGIPSDSVGTLYPGERADILLEWGRTGKLGQQRMRISLDQENFKYPNPALTSHQSFPFLTCNNIDTASLMRNWEKGLELPRSPFALELSTASITPSNKYYQVPPTADQTILLWAKTEQRSQFGNRPMGFINRTSWVPQASPQRPLNALPRESWDSNQFVPFIPMPKNKPIWVDIILNNLDDGSHPFHLHGHNFYVLASHRSENGWGSYSPYAKKGDAAIKPNLNLVDPLRKDTVSVPRRGYVVLRFLADNPGIWMFHCHVLFHMASGMTMGFLVGGDVEHSTVNSDAVAYCNSL